MAASSTSMMPNRGEVKAWDPVAHPLQEDTAKAATFITTTAWMRVLPNTHGNCVLFNNGAGGPSAPSSYSSAVINADVVGIGKHLNALEAADKQYSSMLVRAGPSPSVVAEFERAIGTVLGQVGDQYALGAPSEAAVLVLHAATTVAGVSAFLKATLGGNSAAFEAGLVKAAAATLAAKGVPANDIAAFETIATTSLASLIGKVTAAADSYDAPRDITALLGRFAGFPVATLCRTTAATLAAVGTVVGVRYFATLRQLFSCVFAPQWLSAVAGMSMKGAGGEQLLPALTAVAVKATIAVAEDVSRAVPFANAASQSNAITAALMLSGLTDAGRYQATGVSRPYGYGNNNDADFANREAFVAMTARALVEAFAGKAFVGGPLQWCSKACGGMLTEHPFVTGRPNSDDYGREKRARTEGGGGASEPSFAEAAAGVASWDAFVGDIMPTFLSQAGYEMPWYQLEASLRKAVAPSASSAANPAAWAPQASDRLDLRRASAIVNDVVAIIAKNVSATTFPTRLGSLTARVPSADPRASLKDCCDALEEYHQTASAAAKDHFEIAQPPRDAKRGEEPRLVVNTKSLAHTTTVYPTPTTYDAPIIAAIHSLLTMSLLPPSASTATTTTSELYKTICSKCDLMPCIIELKANSHNGGVAPRVVTMIRARVAIEVTLMAVLRLTQLRHRDQTEYLLFGEGRKLLEVLRRAAVDASGVGISADAAAEAITNLREPLPHRSFNYKRYLAEGSEGAAQWQAEALGFTQGYSVLSSLMEAVFSQPKTSFTSATADGSLVSQQALALEAFADLLLLRIAAVELDVTNAINTGGTFPPLCSPAGDVVAWCMVYSGVMGLATGVAAGVSGSNNGIADRTFYSRLPIAARSGASAGYTPISVHLNPLVVDHPTRGYAIRRVLWQASDVFAAAILRASQQGGSSAANAMVNEVKLEARKFVASLDAFGLLEWSLFGVSWKARFGAVLQSN